MRSAYLDRRNSVLRGLGRHCGELLRVHNSDAGLHVTVLLREGVDDENVTARLGRRGLAAFALSKSYIGPTQRHGLLLGFGCATPHRLLQATRILGEVLRERS
jgi:GntR family transcriptional regulator/MocR family aminotransferase